MMLRVSLPHRKPAPVVSKDVSNSVFRARVYLIP
jgi:hypothetical protein